MPEDKLCETDQRPHGSNSPSQKPNVEINAESLHHRFKHLNTPSPLTWVTCR